MKFWKNNYTILATLLVIGLGLFVIQAWVCEKDSFWYNVVGNIASAILVGGTLSLCFEIFVRNDRDKELQRLFLISQSVMESGLESIQTDSRNYDYKSVILDGTNFCAILNDGYRWVGNNSSLLEKRFDKKGTLTEFFLVNPDGEFSKALARKTDYVHDDLKQKISKTVSLIKGTFNNTSKQGRLKIYYLKNYPTQALYYSDEKVVVTPYQTSSGRNIVPLYEYSYKSQKESIASHLYNDLSTVREESEIVFDSEE